MTNPNDLYTLCRRVQELGGPEMPSHKSFDASKPLSLQASRFVIEPDTYAAVLRDHAAGPVVEWLWDKGWEITLTHLGDGKYDWRMLCPGGAELGPNESGQTREFVLCDSLSAALEIVGEVGDE
jgi:hypothetical protein